MVNNLIKFFAILLEASMLTNGSICNYADGASSYIATTNSDDISAIDGNIDSAVEILDWGACVAIDMQEQRSIKTIWISNGGHSPFEANKISIYLGDSTDPYYCL